MIGDALSNAALSWAPERFTASRYEASRMAVEVGPGAASPGVQDYRSLIMGDNPMHYFRLDDVGMATVEVRDEKGLGGSIDTWYIASPRGAYSGPGAIKGDPNSALTLNGTTQYIQTDIDIPANSIRTFECWCYRATNTTYDPLFGSYGLTFECSFEDAATDIVRFFNPAGTGTFGWVVPVQGTTWHHIVICLDQVTDQGTLWLDGVQTLTTGAASTGSLTETSVTNVPLQFGSDAAGAEFFNGTIDEIAWYGYKLSQAQVTAHYLAGINGFHVRKTGLAVPQGINRAAVI